MLRRSQHVLHRRAANHHLPDPALQVSGLPRLHQQAALRTQARTRHAAAALRSGNPARQDRRAALDRPRRIPAAHRRKPNTITANYLRIGIIGLAECIRRVVEASDWKDKFRKLPRRPRHRYRLLRLSVRRRLPIYWNNMPHSGVQLKLDRERRRLRVLRRDRNRSGFGRCSRLHRRRSSGHRSVRHSRGHRRHRPDARRSRLLLEPRHADDRQRRACKPPSAPRPAGRSRRRKTRRPERPHRFAERRVFDVEDPRTASTFAEAVCLAEAKFGTIGTVGSYTPPRSAAKYKGGGVGPSPTYSLLRRGRRSRCQSRHRHGYSCRSLDRPRYRPRDQSRCWSSDRSKAASTWASAKR